ncbi:MAG: hypothetical protein FWD39_06815 [Clostridiales bacterium]|nr:hypothetical protein [Clostridiales bacterium]
MDRKEQLKEQIKRLRKQDVKFGCLFLVVILIASAIFLIGTLSYYEVANTEKNKFFFIFGLILFFAVAVITIVFFTVFRGKNNKKIKPLIQEFAGVVSEADKALAAELASKWKGYYESIAKWDFDFVGEQEYENVEEIIFDNLKTLESGNKIEINKDDCFEGLYNELEAVRGSRQLDEETLKIFDLYDEIYGLLKTNSYSLD